MGKERENQEQMTKIVDLNTTVSTVILMVEKLNNSIKRWRLSD